MYRQTAAELLVCKIALLTWVGSNCDLVKDGESAGPSTAVGLIALIFGESASAASVSAAALGGKELVEILAGATWPTLSAVLSLSLNEDESLESLRSLAAGGLAGPGKAGKCPASLGSTTPKDVVRFHEPRGETEILSAVSIPNKTRCQTAYRASEQAVRLASPGLYET